MKNERLTEQTWLWRISQHSNLKDYGLIGENIRLAIETRFNNIQTGLSVQSEAQWLDEFVGYLHSHMGYKEGIVLLWGECRRRLCEIEPLCWAKNYKSNYKSFCDAVYGKIADSFGIPVGDLTEPYKIYIGPDKAGTTYDDLEQAWNKMAGRTVVHSHGPVWGTQYGKDWIKQYLIDDIDSINSLEAKGNHLRNLYNSKQTSMNTNQQADQPQTNGTAPSKKEKRGIISQKEQTIAEIKKHSEIVRNMAGHPKYQPTLNIYHPSWGGGPTELYSPDFMPTATYLKLYINECDETVARLEKEIEDLIK